MIDLSYYKNLSNNNPIFMNKIMNLFIHETEAEIQILQNAVYENKIERVGEVAHKLKTVFKSYNLANITSNLQSLQLLAQSNYNSVEAVSLMGKISEEYPILRLEMIGLLTELNLNPKK
jgi:HPt (histidine-containing phosphotransfer) domain-containing protein